MSDMKDILSRFDSAGSPATTPQSADTMADILTRLSLVESLDKNQKSVNQLSAEFKPKTVKVLGAKTDPKNPMGGKLVGGCEESKEPDVVEDIVLQMKRGLDDYLKSIEDKTCDTNIFSAPTDREIGKRVKIDRDLIPQPDPIKRARAVVAAAPIKTIKIDDMNECGIYGDEDAGFEIRRGERVLPTKFKALDHAIAAAETFAARRRNAAKNADYREER